MNKKVLLKQLVDNGTNLRKQITSKVRVSDQGVYPIGEIWDANTVVDVIVNGAHADHDTLNELDAFSHLLDNKKANKSDVYTKDEIDSIVGGDLQIVDQYAIYQFTSYSTISGNKWADGKAQLTGVISNDLKQIVILESTENSLVDLKFYIDSNAVADNTTKYTLYNIDKEQTAMEIVIKTISETTYKEASIKEYIDSILSNYSGGNYEVIPTNSIGSAQIANGSIKLEDLSDEVTEKLKVVVDEDGENASFG